MESTHLQGDTGMMTTMMHSDVARSHYGLSFHPDMDISRAVLGGLLIGASATIYLLFTGRVAGLSSVIEGFINIDADTFSFQAAFMAGLLHGATILLELTGTKFSGIPDPHLDSMSGLGLAFAGFFVGFGTRLSNGCTSGHGVVGLGRRSPRSFVAVLIFLGTAMATASQYSGIFGDASHKVVEPIVTPAHAVQGSLLVGAASLGVSLYMDRCQWRDRLVSYASGILFSLGLAISGMNHPSKVLNFLKLGPNWDPSLVFVLCSAVGLNLLTFHWIHENLEAPLLARYWPEVHPEEKITFRSISASLDLKLILGAALFGLGWGMAGICPGPGVLLVAAGSGAAILYFAPGLIVGMQLAGYVKCHYDKDFAYMVQPRAAEAHRNGKAALACGTGVQPQWKGGKEEEEDATTGKMRN